MSRLLARLRAASAAVRRYSRTRRGRQVLHDLTLAAAAGVAVIEGAHSLSLGAVKAAAVVALKVLLRRWLPVPSADRS